MNPYRFLRQLPDPDLGEVGECVQSVDGLVEARGAARARRLLLHVVPEPKNSGFDAVDGPVVAVTDFVETVPDQIARWVPQPFVPLGTDGFGLTDARAPLRRHFEVDAAHIVVAALHGLVERGDVKAQVVAEAIERFGIDTEALDPRYA